MNNVNPAWQGILNLIPQDQHEAAKAVLAEWDKGVQDQFSKYAPYKQFVDNDVNPEFMVNALQFASDFEKDPADMFTRVNEHWKLGWVSPDEAANLGSNDNGNNDDPFEGDMSEITEHPQFKQLLETVTALQAKQDAEEQERQAQEEIDAVEEEISNFLENDDNKHVNRLFFTNLRAAGLSNEQALEQYNKTVAEMISQQQTNTDGTNDSGAGQGGGLPAVQPVIMGGDGNVGAGQGSEKIKWGEMSKNDLDDIAVKFLQSQAGN